MWPGDLFLDLHCKSLEIRRFTLGHAFFVLFLSKTTKLNLLVSLHEKVRIDFNFIDYLFLSLSLLLSLSPSLSLSLSLSLFPLSLSFSL